MVRSLQRAPRSLSPFYLEVSMVAKRVLASFAIFFAGLAAVASLAALLLSSSVVLAALAKVLRPEVVDFAPVALGLGCFAVLAGFWCVFLVGISVCVPQEITPQSRRGQGLEATPSQSRRGNLLQP